MRVVVRTSSTHSELAGARERAGRRCALSARLRLPCFSGDRVRARNDRVSHSAIMPRISFLQDGEFQPADPDIRIGVCEQPLLTLCSVLRYHKSWRKLRGKEEGTMDASFFFVLGGFLGILSAIRGHIVYSSIRDSFPPQFQDDLSSRYAFGVYALEHSTPLPLQASYVKSLGGGCAGFLCVSLGFFVSGNIPSGCLSLLFFFAVAYSTMKSWKAYKENCSRAESRQAKE